MKIQDVHIRYEDSVSISSKSVAFGVTMESLSAQSCDANWAPGFSHWAKGSESFKILEMQKFAVYWIDVEPNHLLSRLSLGDLAVSKIFKPFFVVIINITKILLYRRLYR